MDKKKFNKKIGRRTSINLPNSIVHSKLYLFGVLFCLFAISGVQALDFQADHGRYSTERHDRFVDGTFPSNPVPNPTFFLADYESQLAGIGWQSNNVRKKAALISPQHFLNANHFKIWGSITFYNQDGELKTYEVESNRRVGGDVAIGKLTNPIPADDKIPFFTLVDTDVYTSVGKTVIYVGSAPDSNRFAVGRTAIATAGLSFDASLVPRDFRQDRTRGTDGDSGSPTLFIQPDGKLTLVGHHVMACNDNFLGNLRDQVDVLIAADGYLLDIVDEGQLGDTTDGGMVITMLSLNNTLDFETVHKVDFSFFLRFMIYNFADSSRTVTLATSHPDFSLTDDSFVVPGNGGRVEAEVAFIPSYYGEFAETLTVDDGNTTFTIPLIGSAVYTGVEPPSLTIDPDSQIGFGDPLDYAFTITNNDDSSCPDTTFDLSWTSPRPPGGGPSYLLLSIQQETFTLAPGETGSTTVSVTPSYGAMPGSTYTFTIDVTDESQEPVHAASISGVYDFQLDTTPPTIPTDLTARGNRRRNIISWTASTDDVGVTGYDISRDGDVIDQSVDTTYTDRSVQQGTTYVYAVRAFDAAGNYSPFSDPISVRDGRVV